MSKVMVTRDKNGVFGPFAGVRVVYQGGHKPGILREFSEHATSGKFITNKIILACSNICVKQLLTG